MRSVAYLAVSARKVLQRQGTACPSCGQNAAAEVVDRKWVVTTLRRCPRCSLLFRTPTTTADENARIYQRQYRQGSTTDLPDEAELQRLLATRFRSSPHDFSDYLAVLSAAGVPADARVLDFGCSWGYGAVQLQAAGYDVCGYEISVPRARFAADRLGVRMGEPATMPDRSFDVFFSAHVLEHVPSVNAVLALAERLLRPGGWFVAFTPNGSLERRALDPGGWHQQWGFVHPQLLDRGWLERVATNRQIGADTTPYDLAAIAAGRPAGKFTGAELMILLRTPPA
jgi:SAM-dependent methyltransferase/ribosomal protein S27AE